MATGDTGKNNDNNNVYIENYNSNTVLYNNNQQVKIERMNDFDHATNNPTAVPITLSSMSASTMAPNVTTTLPSSHQISFYDPFNQNSINNYSPFPQTTYKYEAIRTRSPSLNGTDYNPIQTTSPAYANILTANFDPQLHPNLPYSRNNGNIFAPTIMTSGPVNPLDTTVPPPPATMATEATMVAAASVFDSNNNTTPAPHSNKSNIDNTATSNANSTSTTSNIGSHKQRSYSHSSASSSSSHSRPHHATHTRAHSYSSYKSGASLPSTTVANYQPYPGLISRANLIILGDLDTIMADWQPEEIHQKRRLVQFQRSHIGQDIQCSFRAILAEEYMNINNNNDPMIEDHSHQPPPPSQQQQMIKEHHHHHMDQFKLHHQQQSPHTIVSCIYWDEKNEFYVTSVDCIHLLEDLMNVRFTVEEKNRVRRNLEGFRPLTVSKCKAESAEFFKLIMSFPNPKPRNIEKDVKVFPWRTLPYALKKIVTKYTASPYSMHDHCPTTNTTAPTTTTTTTSSPSSSSPVPNSSSIPRFASNTMNPSSSPSITSSALTMTPTTSVSTSQLMNISPRINSFNAPSRYQQRRASAPPKHFESLNGINMCTYDYSSSSHHIPSTTTTSNNNNINTNANHHHHSFEIRPLSTTDTLSTFQLQRLNLPQMDGSQFNLTGLVDQSDAMNSTNTTATSADTTTATAPIATNNMNGTQHYQSNN